MFKKKKRRNKKKINDKRDAFNILFIEIPFIEITHFNITLLLVDIFESVKIPWLYIIVF